MQNDIQSQDQSESGLEPRGVKGWLKTFCVFATIIYPIGMAINISQLSSFSRFGGIFTLLSVFALFILGFSIYTGKQLWGVNEDGPRLAKILLGLLFVFNLIILVTVPNVKPVRSGMMMYYIRLEPGFYTQRLVAFITIGLWVAYFLRSKRVENTYKSYISDYLKDDKPIAAKGSGEEIK